MKLNCRIKNRLYYRVKLVNKALTAHQRFNVQVHTINKMLKSGMKLSTELYEF
jgi:hypothetical protein